MIAGMPPKPVAPVGRLPFAFAKRHGVLVRGVVDGKAQVVYREGAAPSAVAELRRFLGIPLVIERVGGTAFDELLRKAYEGGSGEAGQIVEGIEGETDLAGLAEGLPEPSDLMESEDDAPVIAREHVAARRANDVGRRARGVRRAQGCDLALDRPDRRRIRPELFRFSTTDRHDLHLAIMLVFEEAAILQPALAIDEVRSGRGYQSDFGRHLHFGLGTRTQVEQVEVRWPSGIKQIVKAPPVDRLLTIPEEDRP